jgi:hypothetical protein
VFTLATAVGSSVEARTWYLVFTRDHPHRQRQRHDFTRASRPLQRVERVQMDIKPYVFRLFTQGYCKVRRIPCPAIDENVSDRNTISPLTPVARTRTSCTVFAPFQVEHSPARIIQLRHRKEVKPRAPCELDVVLVGCVARVRARARAGHTSAQAQKVLLLPFMSDLDGFMWIESCGLD